MEWIIHLKKGSNVKKHSVFSLLCLEVYKRANENERNIWLLLFTIHFYTLKIKTKMGFHLYFIKRMTE